MRKFALIILAAATIRANGQTAPTIYFKTGPIETLTALSAGSTYNFQVPVERAGHSFTLWTNKPYSVSTAAVGLVTPSGGGSSAVPQSLLIATGSVRPLPPSSPRGPNQPTPVAVEWWLRDNTASQDSQHYPGLPTAHPAAGTVSMSMLTSTWTTISGVANRYFAIPTSKAANGVIYGAPAGVWSAVACVNPIGTYDGGTTGSPVPLPWFTGVATDSGSNAFVADRTTSERAAAGATDVRATSAWAADANVASYPLSCVQVQLDAGEAGHVFTVHGALPDGTQQQIKSAAAAGASGSTLSLVLATGMQFWITRDAEDGAALQPTAPPEPGVWTVSASTTFSAVGAFPATPLRANPLMARDFRINARTRAGHEFSLVMSDGYTSTFGPAAQGGVPAYLPGQIENWLANGAPNHLPVSTFTAMVDPTLLVTLRDNTDGTQVGVSPDINPTDWLDGWHPIDSLPATNAVFTLDFTNAHAQQLVDHFQLRHAADDGWSSTIPYSANGVTSYDSLNLGTAPARQLSGIDGMVDYSLGGCSVGIYNPVPNDPGPFWITDTTTGQSRDSIFPGFNDLGDWFAPPYPVALQISSSRQGHRLAVRHSDGEFFPIQNGNVAGCTSAPPGSPPWYQSYYYFDASAVARSEIPFYVEDEDTGERIGPGPTNSALINWIAVPPPGTLNGAIVSDGTIGLQWSLGSLASDQGGFQIERQVGTQGWQILGTVAAAGADANGLLYLADLNPVPGYLLSYRVRYTYGAGTAQRQSAPSNILALTGWLDNNGNGFPDWFDLIANSETIDSDGDGVSNAQELRNGTNPLVPDNPAVQLSVSGFTAP